MEKLTSPTSLKTISTKLGAVLLTPFKVLLRIAAVIASLVLVLLLSFVLLIFNLDIVLPWAIKEISERYDGEISVAEIQSGMIGSEFALRLNDISIDTAIDEELQLIADAVEIRFSDQFLGKNGLQIAYFGVSKPKLKGRILVQPPTETSDYRDDFERRAINSTLISVLSNLRNLNVDQGSYDLALKSDVLEVESAGDFQVQGAYTDDKYVLTGALKAQNLSDSDVNLRVEAAETDDGGTVSNMNLTARSLNVVWFATIWNSFFPSRPIDPNNVSAVVNANVTGIWTNESLDSVQWDVDLKDETLDGKLTNVKEFIFESTGTWNTDVDGASQIDVNFNAASMDAVEVLQRYPSLFPPKFFKHVSERLDSLWVTKMSGSFSGDPSKLNDSANDLNLDITGDFEKLTYRFAKNWPPLLDGKGKVTVTGKRFDVAFEQGFVHGRPIEKTSGFVDDFTIADPILNFDFQVVVSVDDALDFFGPSGMVKPGMANSIVDGKGTARVSTTAIIPLRRGKLFSLNGTVSPQNLTVMTSYDIEVTDVQGEISFNRDGITKGSLHGKVTGGEFESNFHGSAGTNGFEIAGTAFGAASVKVAKPLAPARLIANLDGLIDWSADYKFTPNVDQIAVTSSLVNVESTLPFPLEKQSGTALPLKAFVLTSEEKDRRILVQVGTVFEGNFDAVRNADRWEIQSGAAAVGPVEMPKEDESGIIVAGYLPEFDYEIWSELMTSDDENGSLRLDNFKEINLSVDFLNFARARKFHDVNVHVIKQDRLWNIDLISRELIGNAQYLDEQSAQEGEEPKLLIELVRCHIPEAQSQVSNRAINPRNLPAMEFSCADTKYGQYSLGESTVHAQSGLDSWMITSAKFKTPEFNLESSGEWTYNNNSAVKFKLTADDFGKAMERLEYGGLFNGGKGLVSGHLFWDDALTKWRSGISSGEYSLEVREGSLVTEKDSASVKLIGILNYDTLLNRVSTDVADFGKEGIPFDKVSGSGNIEAGQINVPGLEIKGSTSEITISGASDWTKKELDLVADISVEVGKPLTTVATIAGGPVTGVLTYLGKQILEKSKIDLFTHRYTITGSWSSPQVEAVTPQSNDSSDTNQ